MGYNFFNGPFTSSYFIDGVNGTACFDDQIMQGSIGELFTLHSDLCILDMVVNFVDRDVHTFYTLQGGDLLNQIDNIRFERF